MTSKPILAGKVYRVSYMGQDHVVFCNNPITAIQIVAGYLGIFN
jgi:hypothetical protein